MAELWQALIDNSGAVIAVFTVVLSVTTIIYVVVSVKLLKQSKKALLADMFLRIIETYRREIKEEGGVINNFETALKIKKHKKGYVVAFSFTKGAFEEVARLKNQEELEIKLIKVEDLLYKKTEVFK